MKFLTFILENKILQLNEALPLSIARRFTKMSKGKYKEMYPEIFGDKQRIYIPFNYNFEEDNSQSLTKKTIIDLLKDQGFKEINYDDNYAIKGKQRYKIGKVLNKLDSSLVDDYKKDKTYKPKSNLEIVISRHPYDIAGMSTDRDWNSCMKLSLGENDQDGQYAKRIDCDIKFGTLIAYLIKEDDKNIKNPIVRVLIKPFIDNKKNVYLVTEQVVYSKASISDHMQDSFRLQVKNYIDENWNKDKKGIFKFIEGMYSDKMPPFIVKDKDIKTREIKQILKMMGISSDDYTITKNGVNVNTAVDINDLKLTDIPFKFNKIKGYFDISDNQLTNLNFCPKIVEGDFYCKRNNITSLEGAPEIVEGNFDCYENPELNSLKGFPKKVEGSVQCHTNKLKTTEEQIRAICDVLGWVIADDYEDDEEDN